MKLLILFYLPGRTGGYRINTRRGEPSSGKPSGPVVSREEPNSHRRLVKFSPRVELCPVNMTRLAVSPPLIWKVSINKSVMWNCREHTALTCVAQWVGHRPTKRKARWFDSQSGHTPALWVWFLVRMCTRDNLSMFLSCIDVSLPLFLPPFPSL